jgi:hypothetical protein
VKDGNRSRAGGARNKPRTGGARNKPRTGSAQNTTGAGSAQDKTGTRSGQDKSRGGSPRDRSGTGSAQDKSRRGDPQDKQPWFGSRASGMGYRPRTWQGYLVMLLLGVYAIFIGTLSADHHSPLILLAIAPAALVPRLIGLMQQR